MSTVTVKGAQSLQTLVQSWSVAVFPRGWGVWDYPAPMKLSAMLPR